MKNICSDIQSCTGCTACANVCPKGCIEMREDSEGFLYPFVDEKACVNCKLCEKTCPVNNPPKLNDVQKGYIVRNIDKRIVSNSTSGGTSAAFANYAFQQEGIIFGVGYDNNMVARHFGINRTEKDRVSEMQGSKYVQSTLGMTFKEVKTVLDSDTFVVFTGTPCQIAGLKSYLNKEYKNLITVDLVCHGVSSPLLFKKYVEYMEDRYGSKVTDVRFRNKTYGYHSSTMMVAFESGKRYYGSGRIDYMAKAYFSGACSRKCCYQCSFKGDARCSDLTIFDSWNVGKLNQDCKDDDLGFTNVFIHTKKGDTFVNELTGALQLWEADPVLMHCLDGVMISKQPSRAAFREELLRKIAQGQFQEVMQRYLPVTTKDHVVEWGKGMLHRMGIMRIVKQVKNGGDSK
ncbi:Coenzyme F420 hydrogenase/dehydrogenase, beta subunit C-terminal domain [Clostridium sp. M62/1]|uniref:Coenzyme F420 hydrogenase/dehydrogenase, beta subunit C-terminal domain n=1 Tax=Clostridium sp. M62/1 TaxID=411486 RepID=UPI0003143BE8|nr:Coenzyme F420 hydrogenase/dehydrogenase, beta subunit C-terminal domain [Clostridium sp. M62/1]UEB80303.1 Coenzyme F420 hydrogenase/dehydrogenase, beta subunit C-terminal domain [Clostridium sp. M62/1]